jgi:hypothetical protein
VIDCGNCTLPDGRQARWLKVVAHKGIPWDIYCDSDGNLIAWGYHESDDLRRRPTQFVVIPTGWKEQGGIRLPEGLKIYEDERHTQTIRWERSEPLPGDILLSKIKTPASLPPPAGLPVTLPVRFSQREIFVPVTLNGREYLMMLDTGAGITVVDQPVAEALRLPPGEIMNVLGASGQGEASVTRLASLQIGSVTPARRAGSSNRPGADTAYRRQSVWGNTRLQRAEPVSRNGRLSPAHGDSGETGW